MSAVGLIPNDGLDYLDSVIVSSDCASWKCTVFANNHTPANTDVVGTYTLGSIPGISTVTPVFAALSASGGSKSIQAAVFNWVATSSSASTIYGLICTDSSGTRLIFAYLLNTPISSIVAGSGLQVTASIIDSNT